MAKQILSGAKLYVDGYNLSGDHNALALTSGADAIDQTTLVDTTRVRVGGLKTFAANHAGFWSGGTDNVDDVLFARLGNASGVVTTICPTTGAEGERSFFATMNEVAYAPAGSVGESLLFSVGMEASSDLYRGIVLANATKTATGTSAIQNLGGVLSTQKVCAALHVVGPISGTSIAVTIQSAATLGFASPTTRFTFATRTTIGAEQLAAVAGPITDAYWRVAYTVVGASPSFPILVSLAIQ